jgi:autotransporter-associated beta strand protein
MVFPTWRQWLNRLGRSRKSSSRSRKSSHHPRLETLELRLAPATDVWTGKAAVAAWSQTGNWSSNSVPRAGDDLSFPAGVPAASLTNTNDLAAGTAFNSITIGGSGYLLQGNSIVLGSARPNTGNLIANTGANNNTISFDIALGGGAGNRQFFTVTTKGSALTLSGHLSGSTGVTLTTNGAGTLVLANDNSGFTGPISLQSGAVQVTNANALGAPSAPTTVLGGAQLQFNNVVGNIPEPLLVNGSGLISDGALLNIAGTNTLTGSVEMDSNTTFGAQAGSLVIQGVVSDRGQGHSLTKEGPGRVVLDPLHSASGNTYRGQTIVNNGTLAIRHSLALGPGGSAADGAIVNAGPSESGTLQLEFIPNPNRIDPNLNAAGDGFIVPNEFLTLNGPGQEGIHTIPRTGTTTPVFTVSGALNNAAGNNTWTHAITLWTGASSLTSDPAAWDVGANAQPTVGIGAELGSSLTIDGVISDKAGGKAFSLIKTRPGRVIFTAANTYRGTTEILDGYLNIRDSKALGPVGNNAVVMPGGSLELQTDGKPDSIPQASKPFALNQYDLQVSGIQLVLMGPGANSPPSTGALHNISGTNNWTGAVYLPTSLSRGVITFTTTGGSIGVDSDPDPTNANGQVWNDFSKLIVSGLVQDGGAPPGSAGNGDLTKVAGGELVLPNSNSYTGQTFINQGWVTIRNNTALGGTIGGLGDTRQPGTTVAAGASLVLAEDSSGNSITVFENITISGTGILNRLPWLNLKGAIENLSGLNTITGDITLSGDSGIGAELDGSLKPNAPQSELTLMGTTNELGSSGIIKLGSQRVNLQGPGTYTGNDDVREGVLRNQNDTGLGSGVGTTTVESGASLELAGVPTPPVTGDNVNGGLPGGTEVWTERLVLYGAGSVPPTTTPNLPIATLINVSDDNLWRGPITFGTDVNIDAEAGSRMTLYGDIDDAINTGPEGSGFTKLGDGYLVLAGNNTFRGTSNINQGTVNLQSGTGLGAPGVSATQTIALHGIPTDTFTLTWDGSTTTTLPFTATPAQIQAALDALPSVTGQGGDITVIQGVAPNTNQFTIIFGGNLTGFTQPVLTAAVGGLPSSSITVTPVNDGYGGTIEQNGAGIELQGDITVAGESLKIAGGGSSAASDLTSLLRWQPQGPAPILHGQTLGNLPVTGRITGVSVDQSDPNVIYISAAGGGAWRTEDGGQTWHQLTDQVGAPKLVNQPSVTIAATNNTAKGYVGLDSTTTGDTPPDTVGAAGPNSYVESVNQEVAIFSPKATGAASVTDQLDHFYATVGGLPAAGTFYSDPIVVYDDNMPGLTATTGRFIVGDQNLNTSTDASVFDIAVSKSANPTTLTTADWLFYQVNTTESGFSSDYPGNFGYNNDAFVFTLNQFATSGGTDHATVYSVDASDLVNGVSQAQLHSYSNDLSDFSVRPTTMHDAPAGSPMWLLSQAGDGKHINVYAMSPVLSNSAAFPLTTLTVNTYTDVGNVPPQDPSGGWDFNIDSRILKAAEANNTLVAAQAVSLSATEDAARWYVIDVSSGSPSLTDQGDVSLGNNTYAVYPGIDINSAGDIGMSFMDSGTAAGQFVSMYITGRTAADPLNTMATPVLVPAGTGVGDFVNSGGRGGDLSGINVDPQDGSFWASNEFAAITGQGFDWGTAVANFTVSTALVLQPGIKYQDLFTGAITAAPQDPTRIYVGTGEPNNSGDSFYGRGVLESKDSGRTWTLLRGNPGANELDRRTISRIDVDPWNENIIYVTVSGNGVNGLADNAGLWQCDTTTDTWTDLTTIASPLRLSQMPPLPAGPDDNLGINFSTTDDYTDVAVVPDLGKDIFGFLVNPGNDLIVMAVGTAAGSAENAVYISLNSENQTNNSGVPPHTWNLYSFPTLDPGPTPRNGVIKVAVSPNASGTVYTVYAVVTYPGGYPNIPLENTFRDVWKTTITWSVNTLTWTVANWANTTTQPGSDYMGVFPNAQGEYDTTIAVDPSNANIVYVAGIGQPFTSGPWMSTDGGGMWTDIGIGADGTNPHVDYHAMSFDSMNRLLVGNDGGVWRLDNNTVGSIQWTDLNGNLAITEFNGIAVDPSRAFVAYAGSQDNGQESYNNSIAWTHTDDGDGGAVGIDNRSPNIVLHVENGTLRQSTDGGNTWTTVLTEAGLYFPFIVDSVDTERVLVGAPTTATLGTTVLESTLDGNAGTFQNLDPNGVIAASMTGDISALAYADLQGTFQNDPAFPLVTDVGASTYVPDTFYVTTPGGVFMTRDHGKTWAPRSGGINISTIASIAVDPNDSNVAYIAQSTFGLHQVYMTTDGGQTWTDLTVGSYTGLPDLPAWKVLVDPLTRDLYLGNDNGVWRLQNPTLQSGGKPVNTTWSVFGVGMANVQVKDMVMNTNLDRLTAGTYGRSAYELWLDRFPLGSPTPPLGALRGVSGNSVWTGNITLTGNATLRAESSSQVTLLGNIVNDNGSDNWTITKIGQGRVVLGGTDAYGGGLLPTDTFVNEGILAVRNPFALGAPSSGTVVAAGAALELQSDVIGEHLTLNGDGIAVNGHNTGALRNVSGDNTYTGNITLATNSTIGVDSGSSLTITGVIDDGAGTFSLTKELTGTLILDAANTYHGTTIVEQGILNIQNALALGSTANGTQVEDGAQLQLQGGITVSGEALTLSGTGVFATGALVNVSGNNTWQGPVTLTSITVDLPPNTPSSKDVSFNVLNAGDTLTIDGAIGQVNANGITTFGVDKIGPGTMVLTHADNYQGLTTIDQGILAIQNRRALGTAGGPPNNGTVVNAGAELDLDLDPLNTGTPQTVFGETLTLNGSGVNNRGALDNVSGKNTWAPFAGNGQIILASDSTIGVDGGSLTVTGDVKDPAPVPTPPATLSKVGTGTLFFPTANDYTGLTLVQNGILNISHLGALGPNQTQEVQAVTVSGLSGSFTLGFNGQTTTALAYNATAAQVQAALNALSTIGGAGGGTVAVAGSGTAEVQNVTVNGVSGSFKLTFKGAQTGSLPFNVTAAAMQSALQNLSTIGANNVTVTQTGNVYAVTFAGSLGVGTQPQMSVSVAGGVSASVTEATVGNIIYTVTFQGTLAGFNQSQLVATPNGGASVSVTTVAQGTGGTAVTTATAVQTVTVQGTFGTFTLTFNGQTTGNLPIGLPASGGSGPLASVQNALDALSSIGGVGGSVTVTQSGNDYTITFGGSLAATNQPAIIPTGSGGTTVSQATLQYGGTGTLQVQVPSAYSNETLQLTGNGFGGIGALDTPAGTSIWDSAILLMGNSTVAADTGATLTVDQTIGEAASGSNLTKLGLGTVIFSGATSNTYTGLTSVTDGTLKLNKSGTALAVPGSLTVGDGTPGKLLSDVVLLQNNNQIAGNSTITVNSDGLLDLGNNVQTTAAVNMTGGTIALTGAASVLTLNGNVTATSDGSGAPATIGGLGALFLGSVDRTFTVAGTASPDMVVNAVITGGPVAGLNKKGTGTLTLGGANTYGGTTTATAGTLLVDGTVGVASLAGGTLGGSGTLGPVTATAAGGTLFPGDSATKPGVLTVNGNVTLNGSTNFQVQLNGDTLPPPAVYSLLNVNGNVTLGGARLTGAVGTGFTPPIGDSFTVIKTTGTVSGNLVPTAGAFLSGLKFSITNTPTASPNSVVITRVLPSTSVTVTSSTGNTSVWGQPVKFNAIVIPESGATGAPQGTVTFFVDGAQQSPDANLNSSGVASFTTSTLSVMAAPGHTITARYNGDPANYLGSTASLSPGQVVNKANASVAVAADFNPSVAGQLVTFTATVSPVSPSLATPDGTVDFLIDNSPVATGVALNGSGKATYQTSTLTVNGSPHTVKVVYDGSVHFNSGASGLLTGGQTVNKDTVSIAVAASNSSEIYGSGQSAITATVTAVPPGSANPTGSVTFTLKNGPTTLTETDTLSSGVATLQLSPPVGTWTITATYAGDSNYQSNNVSNSAGLTVTQASTTVAVTSPANPSVFGQSLAFSATISPVPPGGTATGSSLPGGTADLKIDNSTVQSGATVSGGHVTFNSVSSLSIAGSPHSVQVIYNGDTNYSGNNAMLSPSQTVNKDDVSVTVASTANASVYGQGVIFSATVSAAGLGSGTPTGTADLKIDNNTVQSGVALSGGAVSFNAVTNLTIAGSPHSVQIIYNGDGNFNGGNGLLLNGQTVNKDGVTVTVASNANPSVFGQGVVFSATISAASPGGGTPTGTANLVIDGGTVQSNVALSGNTVTFSAVSNLSIAGSPHSVKVVYNGDGNFNTGSALLTGGQTVTQDTSKVTVASTVNPSVFGQPVSFSATISAAGLGSGTPTGTADLRIDGSPVQTGVGLVGGQVSFAAVTNLTVAGSPHVVQVVYSGDANFTPSNALLLGGQTVKQDDVTVTVTSNLTPDVYGQGVTFSATIGAANPGGGTPTGTANLVIDGSTVQSNVGLVSGQVSFNPVTNLTVAGSPHTVKVVYNGDGNFNTGSGLLTNGQKVIQDGSSVTVASSVNPSVYGQGVTFSATIKASAPGSGTPGGTADLKIDGGTVQSGVAVVGGMVTFAPVTTLTVAGSPHTVQVVYDGDSNFSGSNALLANNQTVNKDGSSVTVASSSVGSTSTYGDQVTFTAMVSASSPGAGKPGGQVNFYDNNTTLLNSTPAPVSSVGSLQQASYTTTALQLTAGSHSITAVYLGDANFTGNTSQPITQTVNKAGTTLTNVSSDNPSPVYGQTFHLSATVTSATGVGTPTGTINFLDNGTTPVGSGPIGTGGLVTITITNLAAGPHSITAQYQGDTNFSGSSSPNPLSQPIGKASTSVAVSSSNTNAVYGAALIKATVSAASPGGGTPTGNVTFAINGLAVETDTLSGGVATLQKVPAPGNNYTITATYAGDSNFNGTNTSNTVNQTVTQASTTVASVMSSANPSVFAQSVTFSATISAVPPGASLPGSSAPGGTADLKIDGSTVQSGATVSGGHVSFNPVSSLTVAGSPHTVQVLYKGDANYSASPLSNALNQVVNKASTTTGLVSAVPTSPVYGQQVILQATVTGTGSVLPSGSVTFLDNNQPIGTGPIGGSGQAFLTITLGGGSHSLTAQYPGDSNFQPSQSPSATPLTVQKAFTTVTVSSPQDPSVIGDVTTLQAVVAVTSPGSGTPTGTVTFTIDNVPQTPVPVNGSGIATFSTTGLGSGPHTVTAQYNGDANFAGSPVSLSFQQLVYTRNQAFVDQVYQDLLGRHADPGALAGWTGYLNVGNSRFSMVSFVDHSLEYRTDEVENMYHLYLHRDADPNGLAGFVGYLNAGGTVEQVAAILIGSDEYFFARGGGTIHGWENAMFLDALNRPIDTGPGSAQMAIDGALSLQLTRSQIAAVILSSPEYFTGLVGTFPQRNLGPNFDSSFTLNFYQHFLRRSVDPTTLAGIVGAMQNGLRDEDLISILVGSDEYYNRL